MTIRPIRSVDVLLLDKAPDYRYRLEAFLAGVQDVEVQFSTRDEDVALEETRRGQPALVIVDPAGFADPAALLMRLRHAASGVRVVILTALPQRVVDGLAPHADLVLLKGIDGGELARRLRALA